MSSRWSIFCISLLLAIAVAASCSAASPAATAMLSDEMVEGVVQGRRIEGVLLGVGRQPLALLGRDGQVWRLQPNQASKFERTASSFRPYPPSEFRAALLRELGDKYEVTGTTHYLIAHPRGQQSRWAERFEELYRSFIQYFSVRGFEPTPPPFPLVGIVCVNRREFDRLAAANSSVPSGVVGYYDPASNRISMYDMSGGSNSANWRRNAAVLIHEATHQMAFNTGIHSRYRSDADLGGRGPGDVVRGPRRVRLAPAHANGRARKSAAAAGVSTARCAAAPAGNARRNRGFRPSSFAATRRRPTPRHGR